MSEKPTHSRIRIVMAQFLFANKLELEDMYDALGINIAECDQTALSHMAGVVDGMTAAASLIREHGVDEWANNIK